MRYLAVKHKGKEHFLIINEHNPIHLEYRKRAEEYRRKGQEYEARDQEEKYYREFMEMNIYPIMYTQNIFVERLFEKIHREARILPI